MDGQGRAATPKEREVRHGLKSGGPIGQQNGALQPGALQASWQRSACKLRAGC